MTERRRWSGLGAGGLSAGALCLFSLASCGEDVGVAWQFRFASNELRDRAVGVAAEVRQGGCRGRTVFTTWITRDGAASSPGNLDAGLYGFYGRARDARCSFFAEGCVEVTVPSDASVEVLLEAMSFEFPDPTCAPGTDYDPITGTDSDAGADDFDAGIEERDAGEVIGDGDGDGAGDGDGEPVPTPDAGAPEEDAAEPVVVSQCQNLDNAVVACFDFNGNLDDASGQANDATGNALYEPGQFGQALRADGQPIAVQDDGSLNGDEVTLELWVRPDSRVNLQGNANDSSIMVDKDQQYLVQMNSSGNPVGQIYTAVDNTRTLTAETVQLREGSFVYLAFSYDGSQARLYRDGVLVDERRHDAAMFGGNGGTMHIGSGSPSSSRAFDGLIDALRISNVARSAADICEAAGKTFSNGTCD